LSYLRSLLCDLLGEYSPVVYAADGIDVVPSGAAGVDWPWIASAALLILCVYSIFRIVRCLIAK